MAATNELNKTVDVLNLNANQQAETCGEAKKVVSTRIADRQRIMIRAVHFGQVEALERVISDGCQCGTRETGSCFSVDVLIHLINQEDKTCSGCTKARLTHVFDPLRVKGLCCVCYAR